MRMAWNVIKITVKYEDEKGFSFQQMFFAQSFFGIGSPNKVFGYSNCGTRKHLSDMIIATLNGLVEFTFPKRH